MGNRWGQGAAIGKAEFALALRNVKIVPVQGVAPRLIVGREDRGLVEVDVPTAKSFRLPGLGFDDAVWFACADPEPGHRILYLASEVCYGAQLPKSNHRETIEEAMLEAIKFVLRTPEEQRADAYAQMKALGARLRERIASDEVTKR